MKTGMSFWSSFSSNVCYPSCIDWRIYGGLFLELRCKTHILNSWKARIHWAMIKASSKKGFPKVSWSDICLTSLLIVGVIAAAALKCMGANIQGRLWPRNDDEKTKAVEKGYDLSKVLFSAHLRSEATLVMTTDKKSASDCPSQGHCYPTAQCPWSKVLSAAKKSYRNRGICLLRAF